MGDSLRRLLRFGPELAIAVGVFDDGRPGLAGEPFAEGLQWA